MATKYQPRVDELIQKVSLHVPRRLILHLTIFPFVFLYGLWVYFCFFYGFEEEKYSGVSSLSLFYAGEDQKMAPSSPKTVILRTKLQLNYFCFFF
jgi:hypothetical protein